MKKSLTYFESIIYLSDNKNLNGPLYTDLYEAHLQLNQISDNKPKTKKKIIKIVKQNKIIILYMLESNLSPLRSPE
jgi:hypothetical protein